MKELERKVLMSFLIGIASAKASRRRNFLMLYTKLAASLRASIAKQSSIFLGLSHD